MTQCLIKTTIKAQELQTILNCFLLFFPICLAFAARCVLHCCHCSYRHRCPYTFTQFPFISQHPCSVLFTPTLLHLPFCFKILFIAVHLNHFIEVGEMLHEGSNDMSNTPFISACTEGLLTKKPDKPCNDSHYLIAALGFVKPAHAKKALLCRTYFIIYASGLFC